MPCGYRLKSTNITYFIIGLPPCRKFMPKTCTDSGGILSKDTITLSDKPAGKSDFSRMNGPVGRILPKTRNATNRPALESLPASRNSPYR